MDVFPRCVTSQVHSVACTEAAVGSALLLRPFMAGHSLLSALQRILSCRLVDM